MRPAIGTRGGPASWRRAVEGAGVARARRAWEDARESYLYGRDTSYAPQREDDGAVEAAAARARDGDEVPVPVQGPMLNAPVWTWEVPLYFWLGGIASGAAFAAAGADLAGDERSARVARRVALCAIAPGAPLLIVDLGRPGRFLNMLRIFNPRSPMSMGAWCLTAFSNLVGAAVVADLMGRRRSAQGLGGAAAVSATYLGSYTGVLLASTAVPVWARSRLFLGPIFVCTATATGAAATRLALRDEGPTAVALARVESAAMIAELALSQVNERRLGTLAPKSGLFTAAKAAAVGGLAARVVSRRGASALTLVAGLLYRYAWVEAGKASARDDSAVAAAARSERRH